MFFLFQQNNFPFDIFNLAVLVTNCIVSGAGWVANN